MQVLLRLPQIVALVACISAIAFGPSYINPSAVGAEIEFNRDIRPILSENCFFCHGPDSAKREADLRLDDELAAKESAIVAGDADASELIARITSSDPDTLMPPPSSGRQITAAQVELLRKWINSGAAYQSHWSFIPPAKPTIPNDNTGWSRNEIDQFLLAAMQSKGLSPAIETDRETWLRRVTFDLTGLPPTLRELDEFLNDRSPAAYERVVDRLLASPRYGERMTADWLDVSRYSDSYGMQVDRDRRVWPYRDWVIDAFNKGIGYDQFIIEQVAGDLLPNATRDQVLATAFNRLHPQECEGGSVPEEFRMESVADRTQTVATAFLGLTMECCRCHDHKYDPLSQRDYYSLSSFFDNIDEAGLYSYFTESCPTPALPLPTETQVMAIESAAANVRQLENELAEAIAAAQPAFQSWLQSQPAINAPTPLKALDFEGEATNVGELVPGKNGKAIRLTGDDGLQVGVGNFERWEPFTVALWMRTPDTKDRAVIFHRSRAWTDAASRGYELLIEEGHLQASLIHFWPGNAVSVRTSMPVAIDEWVHVAVCWDGSSRAEGLRIFVDGQPAATTVVRDALTREIRGGGSDEIMIGARFRDRGFTNGMVDDFLVFDRELSHLEIAHLRDPQPQSTATPERPSDHLFDYFFHAVDERVLAARQALKDARKAFCSLNDPVPEIMVMRELPERRQSYLLARGAYDARAETVDPATPTSLPPLTEDAPRNRLGLANWLVDESNPLVARVAVNRFWQSIFGRGLVETPEDFGSQGRPPSHPELLDWLAIDFRDSQWDLKSFWRKIVLSSTYRLSSLPIDPRDPENIYLARAPRYRLSAEMLRDNVLLLSGLLDSTIGGEPAKPYEVEMSFKPVNRDKGRGLYRRSLYTYWKRTGPAPMLTTLDASLRDVCRVKRDVTASPLQSLVMFNSPQFVEASRLLAQRLVQEHAGDDNAMVTELFRLLTSRRPMDKELTLLVELFERQKTRFGESPDKTKSLLTIGDFPVDTRHPQSDVAAMTSLVISLFNFDQSITKR
jgi:hypothetical protein